MDSVVRPVDIAGRSVGPGQPCFIVAEAGVNHNGDLDMAKRLVDAAVEAGADAVKFQSFKAERIAAASAPKAEYQVQTTGGEESQLEMLRRLELSEPAQQAVFAYCSERGILFMSSPFDEESADVLERLGVAVFKIPSGEVTNEPLLAHVARKGKPMIVSTGMSNLDEVKAAVRTIGETGHQGLILLHCLSSYPANPAEANLRAIQTLADEFQLPVGFSDHTPGTEVALAAVALGACVIEKHLTLDQALPGPDQRASTEPREFGRLVRGIRIVESSLGHGRKEPAAGELNTATVARKSLVAARDITAGTTVTAEMVVCKRPGTGLRPSMLGSVLERVAATTIPADTMLSLDMFLPSRVESESAQGLRRAS